MQTTPSQAGRVQDKKTRTPAQQKISSQLLAAIARLKGDRVEPSTSKLVKLDDQLRALVEVRTAAIDAVRTEIVQRSGVVVSVSERDQSVTAWVPLTALEPLATLPAIRFIGIAPEPMLNNIDSTQR